MLEITLSSNLNGASVPIIIEALRTKLDALDFALQSRIVSDKLSGQVLQHRSGKLAASIRAIPTVREGTELVGSVEGGGGPAFYAKFHEYGTTRQYEIVPTNKKALAFMVGGKQVFVKRVMHPPIQERSFMRTTLNEMQTEIVNGLQQAANQANRG